MRSLVRRHRKLTWPLRQTVKAPGLLQSILEEVEDEEGGEEEMAMGEGGARASKRRRQ